MIKIRIRNDDHEIDLQFPISENKLYAKLAEIHAIEGNSYEFSIRNRAAMIVNTDLIFICGICGDY